MKTMNRNLKQALLTTMLFCSATLMAQVDVVHISADYMPEHYEGLYYTLPRTVVHVGIYVEKTHSFKGPYAEFAGRLLGLDNVIRFNNESYVISGVKISTSHQPDPTQQYFIRLPRKKRDAVKMHLAFTQDGMLKNAQLDRQQNEERELQTRDENVKHPPFKEIVAPDFIERVDTFMRKITVDTVVFEEKLFRSTFIHKTTEQKAREAADLILEIEEHRKNILTGFHEVNYSKEAIQYMNEQLLQLQEDYLDLFRGKSVITTHYYTFTVIPEPANANVAITLANFDPQGGIHNAQHATGKPVTITITPSGTTNQIARHQSARIKELNNRYGFWYRIAEPSQITLNKGDSKLASTTFMINQFGVVSFLPYRNIYRLTLYPETGSIEIINLK